MRRRGYADVRAVVPWTRVEPLVAAGLAVIEARRAAETVEDEPARNGNGGGR